MSVDRRGRQRRFTARLRDAATIVLLTAAGVRDRSCRAAGVPSEDRSIFLAMRADAVFSLLVM